MKDCSLDITCSLGIALKVEFKIGGYCVANERFMTDASDDDIRVIVEEWGNDHQLPPEQVNDLVRQIKERLAKEAAANPS